MEHTETNMWGTDKSLITAEDYCIECERELPYHYESCPLRAN